jgi:hypothetical protein
VSEFSKGGRLQAWLAGGLRAVMLPTGIIFRVRIPDVEEMLSKGLLPPDLRAIALKFGASGVNPETMDTEGLQTLLRFMRTLVAHSIRYVWDAEPTDDRWRDQAFAGDPWQPVTVSVGMLEEGSIDGDDYAALQGIVTRQFTPNQITALSMKDHGLIDALEADRIVADEGSGTVGGWASFRGERRGADAGDNGAAVERASVEPARTASPKRQRNRAPARRRATRAADGG